MSLTIIIPTIGRPTLRRAIQSVEQQTVPTNYIVQVDEMEDGAAITRNHAIQTVKTNWVGFCDDDDYLDVHYHEWLKGYKNFDLVVFSMVRPEGIVIPDHTDIDRLAYNWVGISFALRTKIAKAFPFQNMIGEDYDLIMRVKAAGNRVKIAPNIAYFIGE